MIKKAILENGYAIVKNIFSEREINSMLQIIDNQKETNNNFNHETFDLAQFKTNRKPTKKTSYSHRIE